MRNYVQRDDLIFPELSYKIVGCAFEVFNSIGPGHLEKVYQRALAIAFTNAGLKFLEQVRKEVFYDGEVVGYGSLDFLVEEKIAVEIKRGTYFNPSDFSQVQKYLQFKDLRLGILIRFIADKVVFKRVLNVEEVQVRNIVEEEAAEYLRNYKPSPPSQNS